MLPILHNLDEGLRFDSQVLETVFKNNLGSHELMGIGAELVWMSGGNFACWCVFFAGWFMISAGFNSTAKVLTQFNWKRFAIHRLKKLALVQRKSHRWLHSLHGGFVWRIFLHYSEDRVFSQHILMSSKSLMQNRNLSIWVPINWICGTLLLLVTLLFPATILIFGKFTITAYSLCVIVFVLQI